MKRGGRLAVRIFAWILAATTMGCSDLQYIAANTPALFGHYRRLGNQAYGHDRRQTLDVYLPRSGTSHPIVVFWYGGSWQQGRKGQYRFVGAALAERGFITVIPDYRLYPQVKFPALMEDGASAVAWASQHARELGGDESRIVLMGHSAGAHMASLLALDDQYLARAGVRRESIVGLVGLSGPYALDPNTAALRAIFSEPSTPADWQPVRFVSGRAPPTLIIHGLNDRVVSVAQAEAFRDALLRAGVPVRADLYPQRGHADTIASFSALARARTPALAETLAFLEKVTSLDKSRPWRVQ